MPYAEGICRSAPGKDMQGRRAEDLGLQCRICVGSPGLGSYEASRVKKECCGDCGGLSRMVGCMSSGEMARRICIVPTSDPADRTGRAHPVWSPCLV